MVQYTKNADFDKPENEAAAPVRAVARKSTARPENSTARSGGFVPFLPPVSNNVVHMEPTSKIMVKSLIHVKIIICSNVIYFSTLLLVTKLSLKEYIALIIARQPVKTT